MRFAIWLILFSIFTGCEGKVATSTVFSEPVCFLCVPDPRLTPSAIDKVNPVGATTTATEANLEVEAIAAAANQSQPNGLEGATPIGSGTPSSSSLSLTVDVEQPGGVDGVGTYTVTESTVEYGATSLLYPSGFETVRGVTSGDGYQYPRGVGLADGTVAVVLEDWVGTQGISLRTRSDSTHVWSGTSNIWSVPSGYTAFVPNRHPSPDIWLEPGTSTTGEVIRVASLVLADDMDGTQERVRIDTSFDGGVTWQEYFTNLTFSSATIYYSHLRVIYDELGQQIVLGIVKNDAGTYTGKYYVSNDGGATFIYLTGADQANVRTHDIKAYMGTIYLTTIDTAGNVEVLRRAATCPTWESLGNANYVTAYTSFFYVAMTITPDGWLYVDWRRNDIPGMIIRSYSSDGGMTWLNGFPFVDDLGATWLSGMRYNGSVYTTQRIFLLGTLFATSETHDNSVVALLSGGATNRPLANATGPYSILIPSDLPATRSSQWVYAGGSAEAANVTDSMGQTTVRIDNTNATGYWTVTKGATPLERQSAHWVVSPDSTGGSTASSAMVLRVAANKTSGLNTYAQVEMRIDFTNRQVRIYDLIGGANVTNAMTYSTGTDGIEFYLAVNCKATGAGGGLVSAYVRRSTSEQWDVMAEDVAVTLAAGATNTIMAGKLTATTAQVYTRYLAPGSWGNSLGPASTTLTMTGIPARSMPDRIPQGIHLRWQGAPLLRGDSWTVRARSTTPLAFTSPLSIAASPTRQWVGTVGAAGATYRAVHAMPTSYRGKLGNNLTFVGWANMPGVTALRGLARSGGAWVTQITADPRVVAMSSCGIARDSATSYVFYPNSANSSSNLAMWDADAFSGYWCVMTDGGGNTIAGTIARNDPGQFTTASNVVRAALELTPSSVVAVVGTFAGFSLATTTGTLAIYAPDGICIGSQANEAVGYYAWEIDLAPGVTRPAAGLITMGAAYAMARQEREGSSIRYITPDQLTVLPSRAMTGRRVGRKAQRVIELPYDRILLQDASYSTAGAVGLNSMKFNTEPRSPIDNNLRAIVSAHRLAGQRYPVALVINGDWQADPGTTAQSFVDQDVVWGFLENQVDVVAGRGTLRGRTHGHEQGGRLVITEIV